LPGTIDHKQHLKSLDGLRGLAIVMVFLFHYCPRWNHNPIGLVAGTGWMGVDLFFVLSGFLITGILYDTVSQQHYFRNFYARRALRLFPAYLLMVGLIMSLGPWLGVTYTWWDIPFFFYASNIVGDLHRNPGLGTYINAGHLWSLALEEQFYCLWAPVVFLLRKPRKILLACLCGALFSIASRWMLSTHTNISYTSYIELPTRLDGLLCGGALAIAMRTEKGARWIRLNLKWANAIALAAIVVLLICVATAHTSYWSSNMMVRFGYAATSALFASVVALALHAGTWVNRAGQTGLLRMFGKYSYGFYLWHQIPDISYRHFLDWTARATRFPFIAVPIGFILLFAFNMGMAALSYHTIELFFLRMKRYFAYDDERQVHRLVVDDETIAPAT
jgi:peptidoglycan/LPS O-acetylase OafA/YrhL